MGSAERALAASEFQIGNWDRGLIHQPGNFDSIVHSFPRFLLSLFESVQICAICGDLDPVIRSWLRNRKKFSLNPVEGINKSDLNVHE